MAARSLEFCSDAWMAAAQGILSRLVREHGAELGREEFTCTEIFTDPPPHLEMRGSGSVFWSIRVSKDVAETMRTQLDNPTLFVRTDYAGVLPRARAVYGDSPEEMEMRRRQIAEAVARGERQGDLSKISPKMMELLRKFHNELAVVTA